MTEFRSLSVKSLTRVEGEGALRLRIADGRVEIAEFNIYEPPRFFERLLRGREIREVPDITARICGICPVAYQLTACQALEKSLGIEVGPEIRQLRRMLHWAEWVQSHALHIHLLDAPDFLGCESGFSMPPEHAGFLDRGLRLKSIGSRVMEVIGGRAVHPINVTIGGFYRSPAATVVQELVPDLEWGLAAAFDTLREVADFEFPNLELPYEFLSLREADEYPLNSGRVVATAGGQTTLDVPVESFGRHFSERQVPHSTALHALLQPGDRIYRCGPLSRMAHCREQIPPRARAAAEACGVDWPSRNPFHAIVARSIEVAAAFEELLEFARSYTPPAACRVEFSPRAGVGCHATEAPRGLLYHRYEITADGLVAAATIVPPTSQNQARIEEDLRQYLPTLHDRDDAEATRRCEHLVRTYDPCISCATHFIRLERTPTPS